MASNNSSQLVTTIPRSLLLALCCAPLLVPAVSVHATDTPNFTSGQGIFETDWVPAPALTKDSDGLGPYYDAHSCAACHPGGGQGKFPDSLVLVLANDPVYGKRLQQHAVSDLPAEGKLSIRIEKLRKGYTELEAPSYSATHLLFGPLAAPGSLRLPPSLQGVALFELVPEQVLRALADPDDANHDGISGRLTGRYGWKGESNSLKEQVGQALAFDMGLGNSQFPSPYGDCTPAETLCLHQAVGAEPGELEVPDSVLNLLLGYLQDLSAPVPARAPAETDVDLFAGLGCAACHLPELPTWKQPLHAWTDLLLHDMGSGLAAPRGAAVTRGQPEPATAREWRTAPLWGLGQRHRLLHDGRANTVLAAILWHGGEAEASKKAFNAATKSQQEHLLAFLRGL
jgi:CxxC motif-containing protein (DUF1111 family)